MCGICCSISTTGNGGNSSQQQCDICRGRDLNDISSSSLLDDMVTLHARRGPDLSSPPPWETSHIFSDDDDINHHVHLSGYTLWTQGPRPSPQPYSSIDNEYHLLFNGDIYSFTGAHNYENDLAFDPTKTNDGLALFHALTQFSTSFEENLTSVISNLRGPFAFILVVKGREIWFGRDFFGRQSLLFSSSNSKLSWHISSVSVFPDLFEIPATGIFRLDLSSQTVTLFPYHEPLNHQRLDVAANLDQFAEFLSKFDLTFIPNNSPHSIHQSFDTTFLQSHDDDNTTLAKLVDLSTKNLPPGETLRHAATILSPYITSFLSHLRRAIHLRLTAVAPHCKTCSTSCHHSRVGILFSGGLDSTVLAYLAAEQLNYEDSLDLLNVSFTSSTAPDRITGLESYAMLTALFPKKRLNLVLIDETKEDVVTQRRERIKTLISPLTSVIDDSLGCCLWFAGRGGKDNNLSPVRTVLLGSGADELFGGYSRHKSAYERGGWDSLTAEMQMDLDRISIRNMGRDNRVLSDHGLSPRMPFLDEAVVHFLAREVPTWVKCCPLFKHVGLGDKILLRATALTLFGDDHSSVALFPKRAMQFGSRIAKLENSKEKGGDKCARLV